MLPTAGCALALLVLSSALRALADNSFRLERHRRFDAGGSVDHEGGGTVRETRSRHDAHLSRRGSRAIQVLLSGDVPIVQGGGNSPVAARLRGGDVDLIAGIVNILAYSLIVHPDIKRTEDLRGKKLAISRYGSNSDYATRKILIKWGLKPDTDVAIIQIPGGQPTRLASVQNGQVAGLVAQPPVTALARKARLNSLAEPSDFGSAYEHTHRCYRCLHQRPKGYRPSVHPSFG